MYWILGGVIAGALFGEAVGRAYWLWGALVGALLGNLIVQRSARPVEPELRELRRELERLRTQVGMLSAERQAADARPRADAPSRTMTEAEGAPDVALAVHPAMAPTEPPPLPGIAPADLPVASAEPALHLRAAESAPEPLRLDSLETEPARATLRPDLIKAAPKHAREDGPSLVARMWRWLFGENAVVRIGVLILFLGVAFLLKYAYDRVHVPIEYRLIGVATAAVVLLGLGWMLRTKRRDYALVLQGGAVGLLYLTVFGSFRIWPLIPAGPAFVTLLVIALLAAALAVMQDALVLAVLGTAGGFLAPVLASSGSGNHVMLFTYYALLNVGILGIAWFKAWRSLNVLGFVFTFVIALMWGDRSYRPEHFWTTEPFLLFHFALYLVIPLLFARLQANRLQPYVDGTLVFGVPIVGFGMQWALVRDTDYGLAISALVLGAIYLLLGMALWHRMRERWRLLVESYLALGIIFATLAIPVALSGRWTSAAWAIEGAGLVWIGLRQSHRFARWFGLLVQFAAVGAMVFDADWSGLSRAFVDFDGLSYALVALAAFFSSWQFRQHRERVLRWERVIEPVMFAWGVLFWLVAGHEVIDPRFSGAAERHVFLLFAAASAALAQWFNDRKRWLAPHVAAHGLLLVGAVTLIAGLLSSRSVLAAWGWLAWPVAFAVQLWLLRRMDDREPPRLPQQVASLWHAGSLWWLVLLLGYEVAWQVDRVVDGRAAWGLVAWAAVPIATMVLVTLRGDRFGWPVAANAVTYRGHAIAPIALVMLAWVVLACLLSNGDPRPLPYLPLLNPLEIAQIAVLLAVAIWYQVTRAQGIAPASMVPPKAVFGVLAAIGFMLFNTVLMRSLHHFAGVRYRLPAMFDSAIAQACFAIAWALLALMLMFVAMRRANRTVWICGAALLGVVVVKLLLLDLAQRATVERIVAFIGVGVLMLVIGYLAPLPPKRAASPPAGASEVTQ